MLCIVFSFSSWPVGSCLLEPLWRLAEEKKKKARVQTDWAGFADLVRYGCVFYLYLTVLKMFMIILCEYKS